MTKKEIPKKEKPKKERLWLYLIAGIIAAGALLTYMNEQNHKDPDFHEWSAEMDSVFVKNCYEKYKPQVKDDMIKQESMKSFCKCMLSKIKTRYSESEMSNVTNAEIKAWDTECREKISNPNNLTQ
ncbi:MAG TPA: hypothetical protein PK536_14105 [Ignavibacteria bacterium]|nr:hypothetical protein [Ignavibacteria bacterium]HRK00416.1 hypothetical protein [Ignavibacteria bacterium]